MKTNGFNEKNNLNCDIVQDLLPLYHDDVVSDSTKRAVVEHLSSCESCSEAYNMMCEDLNLNLINNRNDKRFITMIKKLKNRGIKKGMVITMLIFIVFIIIGFVYFRAIPKKKFEQDYIAPRNLTAEETIEYYIECIDDRNPAKANLLLDSSSSDIYPLSMYSCSNVLSAKVNVIDDFGKVYDWQNKYYESREYLVDYACHYFLGFMGEDSPLMFDDNSVFFCLAKKEKDSDWKIVDMYTGP